MDPRIIPNTMSLSHVLTDMFTLAPEMLVALTLLAVIAFDWFQSKQNSYRSGLVALAGCGLALAVALHELSTRLGGGPCTARPFLPTMALDATACIFRAIFIAATMLAIWMTLRFRRLEGRRQGEYYALMLTGLLGACLLASANDWVIFILALETLSLPSYVLAAFLRDDRRSNEAGIKYLLYGAAASGIMLFGISYLYGMTGTTSIAGIFEALPANEVLVVPFLFVLAGLGFKVAAAPFHFWAPDVYQGAPTPVTVWLSVASKAAGIAALLRLFGGAFSNPGDSLITHVPYLVDVCHLKEIFWILAALTMTVGNTVALRQTNLKRLLAYSSIAHAGYLLMGFAVLSSAAIAAIMLYLIVYLLMNFGAFLIVMLIENHTGKAELSDFRGLIKRNPLLVVAMTCCLLSLLGIPPLAGFVAKFQLFLVLIEAKYLWLALIGVLNSVISAWYYLKIVKTMVFDAPEDGAGELRLQWIDSLLVALLTLPLLYFGIFWNGLSQAIHTLLP